MDPNPADKILAGYRPPQRGLAGEAWAKNPDRERLEQLWAERDQFGEQLWFQRVEPDPDDPEMVLLMLRPVDPLDGRPAEQVGRWLAAAATVPEERARSVVEEHRDD